MLDLERLNFLTSSETRLAVLDALTDDAKGFSQLRDELDVPQSTLNRNVGKLAEEGWVTESTDRTYRLTAAGSILLERLRPVNEVMPVLDKLLAYPDAFPIDELDFDVGRLADANWRLASEREPYAAINRVRSVYEDAARIKGFAPHYNPAYIDVTASVIQKPDSMIVGLVPEHQLDIAANDDDFQIAPIDDHDRIEYRVWDGDTAYGLAIVDDETVLLTGDHGGGMPGVLVESEDEVVLEWAEEAYAEMYDRSRSIVEAME